MKQRNQFARLSEQDRKHVLDLCSAGTYEKAVEILSKSRADGGLDLITSISSLCRFYTTAHPEPDRAVLAQYATATHVRHQQESNVFLGAIRASAECRVLENFKRGKALEDMEKEIRLLKTIQNLYLHDANWRTENPNLARDAYTAHMERCANLPPADFIPKDLANDPAADGLTEADFSVLDHAPEQSKQTVTTTPPPSPEPLTTPKSPVIPHFPLNSTSKTTVPPPAKIPQRPPLIDTEWKSLLDNKSPKQTCPTSKYAPPQTPAERLLDSHQLRLPHPHNNPVEPLHSISIGPDTTEHLLDQPSTPIFLPTLPKMAA